MNIYEEKKWKITFSNDYCGCDHEEEFIGTYIEARDYADDYLPDYAEQYAYAHFGWDADYDEDEFEDYCENCSYIIEECEDEIDE